MAGRPKKTEPIIMDEEGNELEVQERSETEVQYQQMRKRMQGLRRGLRLTQGEVAARAGLSAHQYGEIERGRSRSNVFTLVRIANALQVSLDFLVTGQEHRVDPEVAEVRNRVSRMNESQINEMIHYLVAMSESAPWKEE